MNQNKLTQMKLGIFDSGVGGLSVARSILESRIFESVIYYGDTARVPYGVKDKDTIIRFSLEALEFFKQHQVDMLVIACNTASAYALDSLQTNATFPIVGVIEPGIVALKNIINDKDKNILVIATKATINSKQYQQHLINNGYTNINALATGLFVPLVEEGLYSGDVLDSVMKHYFADIQTPDVIVLGCTHFPLIAESIKAYFQHKSILIHSGDAIVQFLESSYNLKPNQAKSTQIEFFASSDVESLKRCAKTWCKGLLKEL